MKNELVWTKTILSVYRYLSRICGAIDKIVMQSALNSCNVVGQDYFYNNAFSISQKIIDLSDRKVTLINLKLLTENVLKGISKKDAQILIEKYINGTKCKDIAEKNNISIRTLFRKISSAENSFCSRLHILGYTDLRIKHMLIEEGWINNVFARISAKDDDDFSLSNVYLANAVSM